MQRPATFQARRSVVVYQAEAHFLNLVEFVFILFVVLFLFLVILVFFIVFVVIVNELFCGFVERCGVFFFVEDFLNFGVLFLQSLRRGFPLPRPRLRPHPRR
ncbi:MAG: hypothetical protein M5R40_24445 [Anaerolineae bacterium]|nr:hypothetical protein [Anaerolineae bacterium]